MIGLLLMVYLQIMLQRYILQTFKLTYSQKVFHASMQANILTNIFKNESDIRIFLETFDISKNGVAECGCCKRFNKSFLE